MAPAWSSFWGLSQRFQHKIKNKESIFSLAQGCKLSGFSHFCSVPSSGRVTKFSTSHHFSLPGFSWSVYSVFHGKICLHIWFFLLIQSWQKLCRSPCKHPAHVPCVLNSGQYCHRNLIWGWLEPSSNRIPQHYLTLQTEWVKKGSWWPTYSCVLRETTNVISPSKQRKGHLTLLRRQDH